MFFLVWSKRIKNFLLSDTELTVIYQHLVSIDMHSDGMEQKLSFIQDLWVNLKSYFEMHWIHKYVCKLKEYSSLQEILF
jgi:hypothetical protein